MEYSLKYTCYGTYFVRPWATYFQDNLLNIANSRTVKNGSYLCISMSLSKF